jgi:hypothetical protein
MSEEQNKIFNRERPGNGIPQAVTANVNGNFRDGQKQYFSMFGQVPEVVPVIPTQKDQEPVSTTNPALGVQPIKPQGVNPAHPQSVLQ